MEQLRLLPEEHPKPVARRVPVGELPPSKAQPDYLESVRDMGVFQSVALIETDGGYMWADGRRRGRSAQESFERYGVPADVPALVFPKGTPLHMARAIALMANMLRSPNVADELDAIEDLMMEGATPDDIASQLGLHKNTIRKRLRLSQLVPELREALRSGVIATGVAERAAALDSTRQEELAAVLRENGTLTGKDVDQVKRARQQEAVSLLPDDVFDVPELDEVGVDPAAPGGEATVIQVPATGDPWFALRVMIERAVDLIPEGADPELETRVRSLLEALFIELQPVAEMET